MDDRGRKIACLIVAALATFATKPLTANSTAQSNASPPAATTQELPLAAQSAALLDSYSGEFIYTKNPDARQYPASSTKILTALIVIESGDLDQLVTVAPEDTKVEPSSLNLKPGEQYTRRQMLFGMLLRSANDVAMALARDNAGSVEAFAEKMNLRAAELGATSSHFVNPHGLHDPNHYTTATIYYTWRTPSGKVDQLRNHNRLLRHFAGCNGLKTGYTRPAQQVLVSSALRGGHEVISVVLHTDKPGIWVDSKTLLTYGLIKLGCPPETIVDTTDRVDEPGNAEEGGR
jgi:serine-type D-Ala-D-Ala carboxypeptidase (penicillin-binding protein 5/6)